jgi:hypothetical protein
LKWVEMGVFIGFFERFWLVFSKKHSLLQHAYLYSVTSIDYLEILYGKI